MFDDTSVNDGNAIADCLVQLAPDFFTPDWRSKIISETAGNWKLRVSQTKLNMKLFGWDRNSCSASSAVLFLWRPSIAMTTIHRRPVSSMKRSLSIVITSMI